MTEAHVYLAPRKGFFYIDGKRVKESKFRDSIERSQRVARQNRSQGRFASGPIPTRPARIFIIRGTARPKAFTNARTDKLVTDHFVETEIHVTNIDEQENLLQEKYPEWVHFDTFIEEPE